MADNVAHIGEDAKFIREDIETAIQLAVTVFIRVGDRLIYELRKKHGDEHVLRFIFFRESNENSDRLCADVFDRHFGVVADDSFRFRIDEGKQTAHCRCHNRGKLSAAGLRG